MKPILILAAIAGGVAGTATFMLTGAGLVSAPSPGSIIAYSLLTPKGGYLPMLAGVAVAAIVSFLVAALLLKQVSKRRRSGICSESHERHEEPRQYSECCYYSR